jgi:hypothetical protein
VATALDAVDIDSLSLTIFATITDMPTFLRGPWDMLLAHTTVLLAAAAEDLQAAQAGADDAAAADVAALERLVLRGALLLHLLPALLLSATPADVDDGILRRHRFAQVLAGDLAAVLAATLPLPAASAEAAARRAARAKSRLSLRRVSTSGRIMSIDGRLQSRVKRQVSRSAAWRMRSSVAA